MSDDEYVYSGYSGTLLGPLTTTWDVPSSCTVGNPACPTCTAVFLAQSCAAADPKNTIGDPGIRDDESCWPPRAKPDPETVTLGPRHGWGFYSPGLVCPRGYKTACSAVYGERPGWQNQFTLIEGETAIGCCPEYIRPQLEKGYSCTNQFGNTCLKLLSDDETSSISVKFCDGASTVNETTLTYPLVYTATASDATATAATAWPSLLAPMFQLNFRQSDLTAASTGSKATSGQATQTSDSGRSTSSPDGSDRNGTGDSGGSSGGLSTGAKAGIGVGVAVGALVVLGIVALLLYRKRAAKKRQDDAGALDDYAHAQSKTKHQYGGPQELFGDTGASEMASTNTPPVELPASRP